MMNRRGVFLQKKKASSLSLLRRAYHKNVMVSFCARCHFCLRAALLGLACSCCLLLGRHTEDSSLHSDDYYYCEYRPLSWCYGGVFVVVVVVAVVVAAIVTAASSLFTGRVVCFAACDVACFLCVAKALSHRVVGALLLLLTMYKHTRTHTP
jgi:hypothetical protein